jgi:hypothetical protein
MHKNNHAAVQDISKNTDTPIKDNALKIFFVIQKLIRKYFTYWKTIIIIQDMQVLKTTHHSQENPKSREMNYKQIKTQHRN